MKPDGVQRGLVVKIICCFEEKGFRLCAMKMTTASQDLLDRKKRLNGRPSDSWWWNLLTFGSSLPPLWSNPTFS